ncbi:Aromatic L-amino-acid decarboxylase [Gryllus bimaculatus]|nr:Aromatic L-amino-acid decarboxylase [Gryllus bimaculatus]
MPRGVEGACRIRNSSGERPRTTVARRPADVNPLLLARKISSTHEAFQLRGREQSYQQVCELRGEQRLWKDFAITRKYPHLLLVCVPRPLTEISKGCRRARSRGGHLKNDARGITDVADCHDQYQYGPRSLQLTRVKFLLLKSRANLLATHGKPTLNKGVKSARRASAASRRRSTSDGAQQRCLTQSPRSACCSAATDPVMETKQFKEFAKEMPSLCLQVTHWHSPRFHAYFPTANSYPAIVADMLSGAIACIGFSWIASPACTELEVVMLDWLGKMLELPPEFLASSGGKGGGVIQGTASEATLVALLGAKARVLRKARQENPDVNENDIVSKLVGYASSQAHSSVERAGLLGGVKLRLLPTDANNRLRADALQDAIRSDRQQGLIPFYAVATLGTTSSCVFDPLEELGVVCNQEGVWLHVDAAYAGQLKDHEDFANFFNVDPLYLKSDRRGSYPDFRHWQIPLGRRFRALKLWFVFRLYGIANLQAHIRRHIALAHEFEDYVKSDSRFEIYGEVIMGLVCFRLKGSNELNEILLRRINSHGVIHLVPSKIHDTYFLRLVVCSRLTESHDIKQSWNEVRSLADEVLAEERPDN